MRAVSWHSAVAAVFNLLGSAVEKQTK